MSALTRRPRGGALIEFCLVLPLFLTLLVGAIDWGWYFVVRELVTNATREGARVGAVAPTEAAAQTDAANAVRSYLTGALGATYSRAPTAVPMTVNGQRCISVTLTNYPVVPTRPTTSISGFAAWTRAPTSITATTVMRLEISAAP